MAWGLLAESGVDASCAVGGILELLSGLFPISATTSRVVELVAIFGEKAFRVKGGFRPFKLQGGARYYMEHRWIGISSGCKLLINGGIEVKERIQK